MAAARDPDSVEGVHVIVRQEDKTGDDPTLADLAKRMDAGFAKVDKRFDKVDVRFESLRLETKADNQRLDDKLERFQRTLVIVAVGIAGISGGLNALNVFAG
jgi:hypothetical protein